MPPTGKFYYIPYILRTAITHSRLSGGGYYQHIKIYIQYCYYIILYGLCRGSGLVLRCLDPGIAGVSPLIFILLIGVGKTASTSIATITIVLCSQ